MMLTFAIGDIHGHIDKLHALLVQCRAFAGHNRARYVFLGDYIDRGQNSHAVVETIMAMQEADKDGRVIALKGNHEELLLNSVISDDHLSHWIASGGAETLLSYGVTATTAIPLAHLRWFKTLPTHYDDGLRFFVHAGVRPGIALHQQKERDLLWIREPFLSSADDHGRLIIHGHTPTTNGMPDIRQTRINIDTGAVYNGRLTAAVFSDAGRNTVTFLHV